MPPFTIDPQRDSVPDIARRWAEVQAHAPVLLREKRAPVSYGDLVQNMDRLNAAVLFSVLRIAMVE